MTTSTASAAVSAVAAGAEVPWVVVASVSPDPQAPMVVSNPPAATVMPAFFKKSRRFDLGLQSLFQRGASSPVPLHSSSFPDWVEPLPQEGS